MKNHTKGPLRKTEAGSSPPGLLPCIPRAGCLPRNLCMPPPPACSLHMSHTGSVGDLSELPPESDIWKHYPSSLSFLNPGSRDAVKPCADGDGKNQDRKESSIQVPPLELPSQLFWLSSQICHAKSFLFFRAQEASAAAAATPGFSLLNSCGAIYGPWESR